MCEIYITRRIYYKLIMLIFNNIINIKYEDEKIIYNFQDSIMKVSIHIACIRFFMPIHNSGIVKNF